MRWIVLVLLFTFGAIPSASNAEDMDYRDFGQMPVLQDGRIKPLDSLARVMLKRISGETAWNGQNASQWLAEMFFTPGYAMEMHIFKVHSSQAVAMLGLEPRADNAYNFEELSAVLPQQAAFISELSRKDKKTLLTDETEVLRIYGAVNDFAQLTSTFSLLLPLQNVDDAVRTQLEIVYKNPVSLFDLEKYVQPLTDAVKDIARRKGVDVGSYTPLEYSLAKTAARIALQESLDKENVLVRIIPPAWGEEVWQSPWGVFNSFSGSPENAQILRAWQAAAAAYRAHDAVAWNTTVRKLLSISQGAVTPFSAFQQVLEYNYNALGLFRLAAGCYAIGMLLAAAGAFASFPKLLPFGKYLLLIGLAFHATALAMRMVILMRPPVSTLYESLIFVSFIIMAVGLRLGLKRQNHPAMFASGATALGLLLSSWVFAGDEDTLGVLVAVLNTNFWLATHVICITTGYASALVTGSIAHLYLFRASIQRKQQAELVPLFTLLHRASLVALLFTSVGTMLGGIWADQSWGRFWGWDPKENGALLIVLWLIWLLHGKIAGQLSPFAFAVFMALINIVVALAWIGVNLLGVGLHSYGFTTTAATGLVGFCTVEIVFAAVMTIIHARRERRFTTSSSAG